MSVGMLGHLGIKQETSFGTEATPPTVFGEIKNESIAMDNNLLIPRYVGGIRGNKRILPGPLTAGGSFAFDLTPEDLMGWVLKGVFGQVTSTLIDTGIYSHVFTPIASSTLPSFTVQVDAEAGCQNWIGTNFSGFGLSLTPNALIECALNVISQRPKEAVAATPSYTSLDPFTPYQITITLNGSEDINFEDLSLDITNEYEAVATLNNQRYASKNVAKQFDCSGTFVQEFGDMDMRRRMWGASDATEPELCLDSGSLKIEIEQTCSNGEIVVDSGVYYKLTLDFHEIYFNSAPANISGADDRIMQNVAFSTKYNAAVAAMMTVTLLNSQSGYPDP